MANANRNNGVALIALAVFFLVWGLRATVFYFIDEAFPAGVPRFLYSTAMKFGLWVVPAMVFVRLVRQRPALPYLGLTGRVPLREWGIAGLITAAYMGTVIALKVSLGGKSFVPSWPTVLSVIFLASSCLIEEILFRGLILHELAERLRGLPANLIASLLFVGVHWPHWLWSRGLDSGVVADSVGVFLVSVLFGVVYLRTRSIWPCFIAHVVNNLVSGWLVVGGG